MILEINNTKTNSEAKMVPYADDFFVAGSISSLKNWWDTLCKLGPKFSYFPEHTKSWLIVKTNCSDKAILIFKDTNSQITTQGKRYLGVALGTSQFRDECFMQKINKWVEELHVLSEIAKIEPQDAHTCFLSVSKHKLNYYKRKIPNISKLLRKIKKVILTKFIPAITGGITITENERKLLSLAPQLGELGIPIFEEEGKIEYQDSIMKSEHLCNRITDQFRRNEPDPELNNEKKQIKSMKNDQQKKFLEIIRNDISSEQRNKMI